MGGIMAVGTIDATNITLNDVEITMNRRDTDVGNGGLIGIASGGSNIDGVNANNITVNGNGVLTGGIVGIAHCNLNDIHIKDSTIVQTTYANVGGIAGIMDSGSLTNSSVDNCTISGTSSGSQYGDIGGAVGCICYSSDVIDNVTVKNSTITSTEEVGGIVGVAPGVIRNCKVDNRTITSTAPNMAEASGGRVFIGGDAGVNVKFDYSFKTKIKGLNFVTFADWGRLSGDTLLTTKEIYSAGFGLDFHRGNLFLSIYTGYPLKDKIGDQKIDKSVTNFTLSYEF